jgi:hypothetical protein
MGEAGAGKERSWSATFWIGASFECPMCRRGKGDCRRTATFCTFPISVGEKIAGEGTLGEQCGGLQN